jgi:hypothetical protein
MLLSTLKHNYVMASYGFKQTNVLVQTINDFINKWNNNPFYIEIVNIQTYNHK